MIRNITRKKNFQIFNTQFLFYKIMLIKKKVKFIIKLILILLVRVHIKCQSHKNIKTYKYYEIDNLI